MSRKYSNMQDYIEWRGDLSFQKEPFNEADNLIFSELAYTNMNDLISYGETITIRELSRRYGEAGYDQSYIEYDPKPVLLAAADSVRFGSVGVSHYSNIIDDENHVQFSAVTFHLSDTVIFIAFRGTDSTITGWREDFCMTVKVPAPAQNMAVRYMELPHIRDASKIICGGHSKGGNLAVYSAAFCDASIREKIVRVYSNDGPGFRSEISDSEEMRDIIRKTVHIVPETGIFGLLLESAEAITVIRCDGTYFESHNPYTWAVRRDGFVKADKLSDGSVFMIDVFNKWLESISDEQRMDFIDTVFDSLSAAGITRTAQIKKNPIQTARSVIKAFSKKDKGMQALVTDLLGRLAKTGTDAAWQEITGMLFNDKKEEQND